MEEERYRQEFKNLSICSAKDNWYNNALSKSFFYTLKNRSLLFETKAQAREAIFEFIEIWYNR